MVLGIGVDLCDIGRMKKAVAREGFAVRVFSKGEIEYARRETIRIFPFPRN